MQSVCKYDDSIMEEFKLCHPKQIISEEVSIPIWKVEYKYNTARGNPKTATKYLFLSSMPLSFTTSIVSQLLPSFEPYKIHE